MTIATLQLRIKLLVDAGELPTYHLVLIHGYAVQETIRCVVLG